MDRLAQGAADPGTPIGALAQDRPAGADLKQSLDDLNRSSALLAEDLEVLQRSLLLRGALRRKARGEEKAQATPAGQF